MKNIVLLISLIVFSVLNYNEPRILQSVQTDLINSAGYTKNLNNTFKLIYSNGSWWIYEFDEDGIIVNIFPAD